MSYITARDKYIKLVNYIPDGSKQVVIRDFFTPDDVADFVGLAVKEYIGEKKVSLLDPMGGSGNLFYHVVKKVGVQKFSELKINRLNSKNDNFLYKELKKEIGNIEFLKEDIENLKIKADFVVANLDGNFLGNHKVIQNITNKYCFILDTNSPKNNIKFDKKNFSIEKVILLGNKIGIDGKTYYLYIYKKAKSGNKEFIEDLFYKFSGKIEAYNQTIFAGKKRTLVLGRKKFDNLIEKSSLEVVQEDIAETRNLLNNIDLENRNILSNFSKIIGRIDYEWKADIEVKIVELIKNIQENYKIKGEKLYEILTSLSVSNFLIFSGASGVGKTSLVKKISDEIGGKFLKFPIKSNFTDESGLLGYFNPLLSKYEGTELLDFLFRSSNARKIPFFLLLDEMNLSRIENYFSEFLIKIDEIKKGGEFINLFNIVIDTEAKFKFIKYFIEKYNVLENNIDIKIIGDNNDEKLDLNSILSFDYDAKNTFSISIKIKLYGNLKIIGTINEDDTTFSLSNKVLDRASYINLEVGDLFEQEDDGFIKNFNEELALKDITKYIKKSYNFSDFKNFFNELNGIIQKINPMDAIGYRAIGEINDFVGNYLENFEESEDNKKEAIDLALCQKVWPKMNNYFLSDDKEDYFGKIIDLLNKNLLKNSKSVEVVRNIQNNLFN